MNDTVNELLSFIKSSPTCFHAVNTIKKELLAQGYTELLETEDWKLELGGKYFVTRNLSSIIAIRIPKKLPMGYLMAAAHSDSPSFKIKPNPETEAVGAYVKINTERYGGMICSTWLDRPLSAAGRVIVSKGGNVETRLVDLDRDLFIIPTVAIHMNRNTNENASYNAAVDMQPITGSLASKGKYKQLLAEACSCNEDEIVSSDMFLYCRDSGKVWGADHEFVSAPRLDDLQCAFAAYRGFVSAKEGELCPVLAVFDNEEVGSSTKQGAASTFLRDTLERVNGSLGGSPEDLCRALASSFMVSADNAHAIHPNHPEYADQNHRPTMNGGIVIKHNANQSYTTDAVSSALFSLICKRADVPTQHYTNRADMPGGSTLGNISNRQIALNTVDIGLAQLSMHSAYETAGAKDTELMVRALTEFFGSEIVAAADGAYTLK